MSERERAAWPRLLSFIPCCISEAVLIDLDLTLCRPTNIGIQGVRQLGLCSLTA